MTWSTKMYIKNVCEHVEKLFETQLQVYGSPLEDGYHPEIDETPLLSDDMVCKYQMLVGSANWVIILGRFDVMYAV